MIRQQPQIPPNHLHIQPLPPFQHIILLHAKLSDKKLK
jgi:hypothetical protein